MLDPNRNREWSSRYRPALAWFARLPPLGLRPRPAGCVPRPASARAWCSRTGRSPIIRSILPAGSATRHVRRAFPPPQCGHHERAHALVGRRLVASRGAALAAPAGLGARLDWSSCRRSSRLARAAQSVEIQASTPPWGRSSRCSMPAWPRPLSACCWPLPSRSPVLDRAAPGRPPSAGAGLRWLGVPGLRIAAGPACDCRGDAAQLCRPGDPDFSAGSGRRNPPGALGFRRRGQLRPSDDGPGARRLARGRWQFQSGIIPPPVRAGRPWLP